MKNGLHILPKDNRDFSLAGFFGQLPLESIPKEDFYVSQPLVIKDQGETDYCSAYAVTGVSEDQEEVVLLPHYQFYKTKLLSGDPENWGADLRTACKSAVQFGSLSYVGFQDYEKLTREELLDPRTWTKDLVSVDLFASQHKKMTFFSVDGSYDTYDNIRAAMWGHIDEKRSIVVGALWRTSWITCPGGLIPEQYEDGGFGHAFKIFGQKNFPGEKEPRLVAQLSNGTAIGDGGLFYFTRDQVNKEFTPYGQFMFKDVERKTVESGQSTPWYAQIISSVINLFSK